jgi:hypothetical protein
MPDTVLTELAHQVCEIADSEEHRARRRLWADLHALRPPRALVSYAMYTGVWEREIAPPGIFRHATGLARQIETQLRARLWKAAHIPDDEPLLPTIWLWMPHPPGDDRLWGVSLPSRRTDASGSYKPIPPIIETNDLDRLHAPPYEEDAVAKRALEERARELLGDLLPVKFHSDELHFGPFEWAVRLRGMDSLLYDVYDRPAFVHRLMAFITEGMAAYHCAREAAGAVDAEASWGFHMYYDELPPGAGHRLKDCWAYVHAQSSASFSPKMYAEFVQPYNVRIASLFGKVYYHGCEDLSGKCAIIRDLPNLRLFHVSPWTPVEPVVACLSDRFALEVHSHPTNVLFTFSPAQMREEIRARHRGTEGAPHVLKLCDVETVGGSADRLRRWAETAREVVMETEHV